ncbi:MAG TPA: SBBP repeat-containing protein [Verrucomicrobiae bacterium]|nr:SBBP repeat-containing protein [Verrucomicrobiae bacterium]
MLLLACAFISDAARPPTEPPARYGQFPAYFEANRGQADSRFQFIARGRQHGVYLAPTEAVVALVRTDAAEPAARFLRMTFPGANARATAAGLEPLPGAVNYFLGSDPSGWRTGVPTFARVRVESLYPGVDLVYYGHERQLEYDFIIAPGADPRAIALRFEGADRVELSTGGELILEAAGSRVYQHKPLLYQTHAGARREVPGRYEFKDGTVRFAVGHYDTNLPLVIDPVLSYSTYLGAHKADVAWSIAVDSAGSAHVAGETLSVFSIPPLAGFQTNFAGGNTHAGDAFVAKLNPAGTGFDFLTYLGGTKLDGAVGLALDSAGNTFVTGYTDSDDFPVTPGALSTNLPGKKIPRTTVRPADAFVAKLNPSGSTLIYSTYLGGCCADTAMAIAVDAAGCAHVTGNTESTNFPVAAQFGSTNCGLRVARFVAITNTTPVSTNVVILLTNVPTDCPFQSTLAGGKDAFLAKLNPVGTALVYSTYFGGAANESGTGIALDSAGNAYVTGWTEGPDFPVSTNAFQPEAIRVGSFHREGFVTEFDPAGALLYSTYLGGAGDDIPSRIAVDGAGSAYITGAKNSIDFPSTPNAFNRGGVFKSTDAAGSWTLKSAGFTHTIIEALAAEPGNPATLYAGTPRGVFRSDDAAENWTLRNGSLGTDVARAFAFDPVAPTNVFAGTSFGVAFTIDRGATWFYTLTGRDVRALLFPGVTADTLLAGTHGSGVLRSTNAAVYWKSANSGLGNLNVNAFAVHPADPQTIYAATDGGVYKSTNNGAKWRSSSRGLITKRSHAIALDPAAPETLYLGTSRGIFKTTDAATNWALVGAGLSSSNVMALAIDPAATSTLYAGTTNGLFKSTDGGANWLTNDTGLAPRFVRALVIDPTTPATLFAGLRSSNSFGGSNDVFLTKLLPDGSGLVYSLAFGGKKTDQGWGVAVDTAGRAYVVGSTDSTNFPTVNPGSLAATNAGKTDAFLVQFDAAGATLLFSGLLGGKSRDFGYAIALDSAGAAYITGRTESTNLPLVGPIQAGLAGKPDAFVAKVLDAPCLAVARDAERVLVKWPGPMPGYILEAAEYLTGPWTPVAQTAAFANGWNSVILPPSSACRFFRLKAAPR